MKTFNGLAQVLLQSNGEAGEATLTIGADNLPVTTYYLKAGK
jgi:beta-galactosidase